MVKEHACPAGIEGTRHHLVVGAYGRRGEEERILAGDAAESDGEGSVLDRDLGIANSVFYIGIVLVDAVHHLFDADGPVVVDAGLLGTLQVAVAAILHPQQGRLMVVETDGTEGTGWVARLTGLGTGGILTQQTTAGLLINIYFPQLHTLYLNLSVVVQRLDDGQRLDMLHASLSEQRAAILELLLDNEAHAHQLGTSLTADVYHANGGIAIGQEVVDEEHTVVRRQIFAADNERIVALLGERAHLRDIEIAHR